jgi:hypothetical protein
MSLPRWLSNSSKNLLILPNLEDYRMVNYLAKAVKFTCSWFRYSPPGDQRITPLSLHRDVTSFVRAPTAGRCCRGAISVASNRATCDRGHEIGRHGEFHFVLLLHFGRFVVTYAVLNAMIAAA